MGVLDDILAVLSREADLEWLMIDSTIVRAHQHAAAHANQKGADAQGLGRSRGGLSTKIHAASDALGNPVRLIASPGQRNDTLPSHMNLSTASRSAPRSRMCGIRIASVGCSMWKPEHRRTADHRGFRENPCERLAVAQETGLRDEFARCHVFVFLVPILLLVIADLIRRMFAPIAALSTEIDQRGERDLHPFTPEPPPAEIRPFVTAINRLLGRVSASSLPSIFSSIRKTYFREDHFKGGRSESAQRGPTSGQKKWATSCVKTISRDG